MEPITHFASRVCDELKETLLCVPEEQVQSFFNLLVSKHDKSIFVCGAGRCQYVLRAFCMRLMHLGFKAHVVGDTTTPAIQSGDLLVIADGAGYLTTIAEAARLAKGYGAEIAVLTILPDSLIGRTADHLVVIPGRTAAHGGIGTSIQPGGGKYEQSLFILLDSIVAALVEHYGLPRDAAFSRHANLE